MPTLKHDMLRGLRCRCPACGEGKMFGSYLKVADHCPHCGEEFHHHRADDLPAYLVVLLLGHVFVPLALEVERGFSPALWVHVALWGPSLIIAALLLLPPVKGAIVALQWHMGMHGFSPAKKNREEKKLAGP